MIRRGPRVFVWFPHIVGIALITMLPFHGMALEKTADGYVVEKNGNPDAKVDPATKAKGEAAAKAGAIVTAQAAAKGADPASAARRIIANKRNSDERRAAAAEAARRAAGRVQDQVRQELRDARIINGPDRNQDAVTARLQTLGKKEIFFIHQACGLSPEEKKQLYEGLEQEIKKITDPKNNGAGGRRDVLAQQREDIVFMNGAQVRMPPGAYERVPNAVLRIARNILPAEKRTKLEAEIEQRKKFRRQGSVMGTIVGIDKELSLSPEQREKLIEVLTEKWDDSWGVPPEMLVQNNHMIPPIPSKVLEGVLTESQLKTWQSLPKVRTAYNVNAVHMNQEASSEDYEF